MPINAFVLPSCHSLNRTCPTARQGSLRSARLGASLTLRRREKGTRGSPQLISPGRAARFGR